MKNEKEKQEVIKNTPRIISVCDFIGLPEDDEDRAIYARREYEHYRRMQ